MKTILIDDEPLCIKTLQWEIERHLPELEIVACCSSGAEGLKAILAHQPAVVFLDIEMPYLNGFEMLEQLPVVNFHLVFTTAYDEFAIKAIKYSALDYLLKPVSGADLLALISRLSAKSAAAKPQLDQLLRQVLSPPPERKQIALATSDGLEVVKVANITHAAADSNYTHVHLVDGKKIVISRTLKQLEAMLADHSNFLRIHQSYCINLDYVVRYQKGNGGKIILANGTELPVARNRKEMVIQQLTK
ncbi:MAG: LytTR family DNA-binding domain-containing protein [Bacteroidota bacterium]